MSFCVNFSPEFCRSFASISRKSSFPDKLRTASKVNNKVNNKDTRTLLTSNSVSSVNLPGTCLLKMQS